MVAVSPDIANVLPGFRLALILRSAVPSNLSQAGARSEGANAIRNCMSVTSYGNVTVDSVIQDEIFTLPRIGQRSVV